MEVQYILGWTQEVRNWISLLCIPFRRSLLQNQQLLRFMRCAMVYVHFGYSNQLPKGSTNAIALHIFGWFWMGPCNRAWSAFGQALFHDFLEKAISQVRKNVAEPGDVGVGFIDGNLSSIERIDTLLVQCKAIVSHHFSPRHAFFSQSVFEYLLPKNWKLLCIKPRLNMSAGLQMQVVIFFWEEFTDASTICWWNPQTFPKCSKVVVSKWSGISGHVVMLWKWILCTQNKDK